MTGTDDGAPGDLADGARLPAPGPVEDALITRLQLLSDELDDRPSPEFVESTRTRLVAMAAVRATGEQPAVTAAGSARPPVPEQGWRGALHAARRRWRGALARTRDAAGAGRRPRLVAGLAGGALLVAVLGTLVALSQSAKPGDVLYSVKRGSEQVELALAGEDRGTTLLHLASTRLGELRELIRSSGTALPFGSGTGPDGEPLPLAAGQPTELFVETLQTMDEQTQEGTSLVTRTVVEAGDPALLSVVAEWAAEQREGLAELEPRLPADVRETAARSLALLDDVGARGDALRTAVDCPAGPAVTGQDELGPVPATCPPEPGGSPGPAPTSPGPGTPSSPPAPSSSPGAATPPAQGGGTPEDTPQTGRPGGERPPTSAAPTTTSAPAGRPSGGPSRPPPSSSSSPTTDARSSPPAGTPSSSPSTGRPSSPPPPVPPSTSPTTGRPSSSPAPGTPSASRPGGPTSASPTRTSNASAGPPSSGRSAAPTSERGDESPADPPSRPSSTASAQPSSTSPSTPTGAPTSSPTVRPSDGPPAGPPEHEPTDPPGKGTPPSDPPGKGDPPDGTPTDPPGGDDPPGDPPGKGGPPDDPPGKRQDDRPQRPDAGSTHSDGRRSGPR